MNRAVLLIALASAGCVPQVGPPVGGGGAGGTGVGGGMGGGAAASCTDGQRDGDETDVDCGGTCAACAIDKLCVGPADCASGVCSGLKKCVAPADPCPAVFAGCTSFVDATDAGAPVVRFPIGGNKYSPACVRLRLGQSIDFKGGDFGGHPLLQACGPVGHVVQVTGGSSATVVMDDALGLFGYYCDAHGTSSGSGMAGAIEVVR